MSLFLSADDLRRITGKARYTAQRRALDALGIKYLQAANGEPLVRSDALESPQEQRRYNGPRWDRIAS